MTGATITEYPQVCSGVACERAAFGVSAMFGVPDLAHAKPSDPMSAMIMPANGTAMRSSLTSWRTSTR
jgi:hypothetical protein